MEKTEISETPALYLFYGETFKIKYSGTWTALAFINWIKKMFRETPDLSNLFSFQFFFIY